MIVTCSIINRLIKTFFHFPSIHKLQQLGFNICTVFYSYFCYIYTMCEESYYYILFFCASLIVHREWKRTRLMPMSWGFQTVSLVDFFSHLLKSSNSHFSLMPLFRRRTLDGFLWGRSFLFLLFMLFSFSM